MQELLNFSERNEIRLYCWRVFFVYQCKQHISIVVVCKLQEKMFQQPPKDFAFTCTAEKQNYQRLLKL